MKRLCKMALVIAVFATLLAAGAGCSSQPQSLRARAAGYSHPAAQAHAPNDGASVDLRASPPSGDAPVYSMRVESEPSGAQVVVDGTPVAKTPCTLVLNGSAAGFCLSGISVKARFIATDAEQKSQTVEELFTSLDKIPARLLFTPQGATRVLDSK